MPEYNYPNPDDPDFNRLIVDLIRQAFEKIEAEIQQFKPIDSPDQPKDGQMFYDGSTNKLKFVTPNGVQTLKYE
jgi:hypothetical protein